jgi:DNA-binding MarR family transcriptional regulator
MAHALQRMERDELIQRSPDPEDRRRARITLTERARALESSLTQAVREVNAAASRDFTDEEAITCMRLVALCVPKTSSMSCDLGVLVDDPAEAITPPDSDLI